MSDEKQGFLSREYTRRQFMKLTAKGMSGVALSSSLLALMNVTAAQAASGQVQTIATPLKLLVVNRAKCTGCQRCELNCTLINDGDAHPYMARLRVRDDVNFGPAVPADTFKDDDGFYGNWSVGPDTCKQCGDPACMNVCPVKAIYAHEVTGARMVDASKCVGCGACAAACPWKMPRIDQETKVSTKCINCGTCVAGCPTSAITMIDWEDVAKAM